MVASIVKRNTCVRYGPFGGCAGRLHPIERAGSMASKTAISEADVAGDV